MGKLKELNNAWLSPGGRIVFRHKDFYGDGSWHMQLAQCILMDMWKLSSMHEAWEKCRKEHNKNNPSEHLEELGWIRLHGFGGRTPIWIADPERITKKQERTIADWCIDNNRIYSECFSA